MQKHHIQFTFIRMEYPALLKKSKYQTSNSPSSTTSSTEINSNNTAASPSTTSMASSKHVVRDALKKKILSLQRISIKLMTRSYWSTTMWTVSNNQPNIQKMKSTNRWAIEHLIMLLTKSSQPTHSTPTAVAPSQQEGWLLIKTPHPSIHSYSASPCASMYTDSSTTPIEHTYNKQHQQ